MTNYMHRTSLQHKAPGLELPHGISPALVIVVWEIDVPSGVVYGSGVA